MSDRPIQMGDLVQVVRPTTCCNSSRYTGYLFVVRDLRVTHRGSCAACGQPTPPNEVCAIGPEGAHTELPRLRRIPPLSELEGVETEEGVKV